MRGLGRRPKVFMPQRKDSSEISGWGDKLGHSGAVSPADSKMGNMRKQSRRNVLRKSDNFEKKSDKLPKIMKVNNKNNSQ